MARDHPVTDAEIDALREEMQAQREEIRADLEAAGVDVSSWDQDENHDQREARADGGD
jgi:GH25 family lysozyme M1 (1,4-beta-N-acetylmuramidase)